MATDTARQQLSQTGFVRVWNVVGDKKRGIQPLIPKSRSSFLSMVKSRKYPWLKAYKLGERTTAYRVEDIRRLIEELGGEA